MPPIEKDQGSIDRRSTPGGIGPDMPKKKRDEDINWHRVFVIRCKSKSGGGLTDDERDLCNAAYKADPKRYAEMDDSVFDATVPAGSTVTAASLRAARAASPARGRNRR